MFEWRRDRRIRRIHAFDRAPGLEVRRIRRIHAFDRFRGFEAIAAARNNPKPVTTAMDGDVTTATKSLKPNKELPNSGVK